MLTGVIFDMDGVITNTMPYHFVAWKAVLKDAGIFVTHEDIYIREGQKGINSVKELFRKYSKKFNEKEAESILFKKELLFKKLVKTRFISGSRSFIKELHRKNISLGLVTGTSRHELERILPAQFRELFNVIVTGSDVKKGKPHPEPYLQAIKKLKLKKSSLVVIENAPFGIKSARGAGLTCYAVETSLSKIFLTEANQVFENIPALKRSQTFRFLI